MLVSFLVVIIIRLKHVLSKFENDFASNITFTYIDQINFPFQHQYHVLL